jgi:hypothetical protein
MDYPHGTFSLSMLILLFQFRFTEADAKVAIHNGIVKVNGVKVVDPNRQFVWAQLHEIQCGSHVYVITKQMRAT